MASSQELILEGVRILCIEGRDLLSKAEQKLGDAGLRKTNQSRMDLRAATQRVDDALSRVIDLYIKSRE